MRRPPAAAVVRLRPDGAGWLVGFDGATFVLPDLKGLRYLRELARRPGADVAALELAGPAGRGIGVLTWSPAARWRTSARSPPTDGGCVTSTRN